MNHLENLKISFDKMYDLEYKFREYGNNDGDLIFDGEYTFSKNMWGYMISIVHPDESLNLFYHIHINVLRNIYIVNMCSEFVDSDDDITVYRSAPYDVLEESYFQYGIASKNKFPDYSLNKIISDYIGYCNNIINFKRKIINVNLLRQIYEIKEDYKNEFIFNL